MEKTRGAPSGCRSPRKNRRLCGQKPEGRGTIVQRGFRVNCVFPNRMILEAHLGCFHDSFSYTKCMRDRACDIGDMLLPWRSGCHRTQGPSWQETEASHS